LPTLSYQAALSYSLKLLSGSPRSRVNVLSMLEKKGFRLADRHKVVARLEELNLINDKVMAERVAEDLMKRQPSGRRRLRQVLGKKKIPSSIVRTFIEDIDEERESARAFQVAERCQEKWRSLPRDRRLKRIYDLLVRRGFDFELCREVLEKIK